MSDNNWHTEFSEHNFFLTGATGFLGRTALNDLCVRLPPSARIYSCSRKFNTDDKRIQTIRTDLSERNFPHIRLAEADYVIWMAAERNHRLPLAALWPTNVAPILTAIRTLQMGSRLKRFVYVSSIAAVDQTHTLSRPIDDESIANPTTAYGMSKLLSETALRASGLPVTILRLPFLYGPGYPQTSFLHWYTRVARGHVFRHLHFTGRLSLLYTGDFGKLLLRVLLDLRGVEDIQFPYVVSDGEVYEVGKLIALVGRLIGRPSRLKLIPPVLNPAIYGALACSEYRYWRHAAFNQNYFVVDPRRFFKNFPDVQFTPIDTALRQCFQNDCI